MAGLFPLPLTPFEEYLLADDSPRYPMSFVFQIRLEGELRQAEFARSVADALRQHPLLQSLIERRQRPRWWHLPGRMPAIDWADIDEPITCRQPYIDLSREIGLRCWVRVGGGESLLICQFHHTCCDAIGALGFIADLAAAYGRLCPSFTGDWQLTDSDPAKLQARDELSIHYAEPISRTRFVCGVISNTLKVMFRLPAPIARPRTQIAGLRRTPLGFPGLRTYRFDPEVFPQLRRYARQKLATVNDVLIRDLMLTIREWNRLQDPRDKTKWLSVAMPTNLRNLDHDGMPAANVVSISFVVRAAADCDDPDALLDSIREENDFVKRWRYTTIFLNGLSWVRRLRLMNFSLTRPRAASSSVLSFVGDPSRLLTARLSSDVEGRPVFGNLKVLDMAAAPPIRPLTRAAFGCWHINGVLHLGMNCDPHIFSAEEADQLLEMFGRRVEATARLAAPRKAQKAAA